MYEGFSNYAAFENSVSDGFVNGLSRYKWFWQKPISIMDAASALGSAFGDEWTVAGLRAVTPEQIAKIQRELSHGCGLNVSAGQIVTALKHALVQSVGGDELDYF